MLKRGNFTCEWWHFPHVKRTHVAFMRRTYFTYRIYIYFLHVVICPFSRNFYDRVNFSHVGRAVSFWTCDFLTRVINWIQIEFTFQGIPWWNHTLSLSFFFHVIKYDELNHVWELWMWFFSVKAEMLSMNVGCVLSQSLSDVSYKSGTKTCRTSARLLRGRQYWISTGYQLISVLYGKPCLDGER